MIIDLIVALQNLPAARLLPSPNGRGSLVSDLGRYISLVDSDNFDVTSVTSLLKNVVQNVPDPKLWSTIKDLVTQSTPPPRPLPNLDQQ